MVLTHIAAKGALADRQLGIKSGSPAYLVELRRGDALVKVLIDAESGQLLRS